MPAAGWVVAGTGGRAGPPARLDRPGTSGRVALGLATTVADQVPRVGLAMQTHIVGVIAFNQTIGWGCFPRPGAGPGAGRGVTLRLVRGRVRVAVLRPAGSVEALWVKSRSS
jgi:hypothetical protein